LIIIPASVNALCSNLVTPGGNKIKTHHIGGSPVQSSVEITGKRLGCKRAFESADNSNPIMSAVSILDDLLADAGVDVLHLVTYVALGGRKL
jgi:hypothetical protein